MLCELNVENLLLIERAQLRLAPGLNVLTGETGAGKTVLAHALDLLLGGRARPGIVRPGASEAYVEGVFQLSEALREELGERLPVDAQEIVLARRIDADGPRTRAYLNGRVATVADLRDLGARLVSFYGQHEHRKLTLAGAQMQILDNLCGTEQPARLRACAEAYRTSERLLAELEELRELSRARERELDLLDHELAEIDDAAPDESEYERLLVARERLRRLDALCSAAGYGAQGLAPDSAEDPGAVAVLAAAAGRLDAVAGVDPVLDALAERLGAIVVESGDLAAELRDYGERLAGEDGSLDEVEQRLAATERLLRKHGGSIAAVLAYAEHARARREELDGVQGALAQTDERLTQTRAELDRQVEALRQARELAAPRLAAAVREQLAGGGLQLTARRRARQLHVRHDSPALPGRCTRFNPRRLYHHRMHVIARHQLGYGTQAGISLATDDPRTHRVRDRRMLKSGTDQSGCPGKAHSPLICTALEIAPPRGPLTADQTRSSSPHGCAA